MGGHRRRSQPAKGSDCAVEVLDALNSDTKLFCPPDNTDNLQRVRTIVSYIEARPERKNEDFRLLANEAMAKAWPCTKS
jgi:Ssp1 endopeptidase immunity protein Rap1a